MKKDDSKPAHVLLRWLCMAVCLFGCMAAAVAQDITALVDGGGTIMQARTVFLIFWLPPGFHYDSSKTAAADTTYENLLQQLFNDLSGSDYLNILSQYPGPCAPPVIATTSPCFGPITSVQATVDTRAYAAGAGTVKSPVTDADVQAEVTNFITANKLTPDLSMAFFVFLGSGVIVCGNAVGSPGCTSDSPAAFCAYHESFVTSGGTAIYGVMPNVDSIPGCGESISSGPNQLAADRETVAVSHEFSESITDPGPGGTGWRAAVNNREVGDNCNPFGDPQLGTIAANGSNVTINGRPYVLQAEWSDADDACILGAVNNLSGASAETTFTTGDDDLRGNSGVAGSLLGQDNSQFGVFIKSPGQPPWDNNSIHVRVSPTSLTAPLTAELLALTSHDGFLQSNDHWNIEGIDLKLRSANGTILCEQTETGSPLIAITDGSPATFPTPNCLPPPQQQEAVTCSVFDDGYSNQVSPADAIFTSGRTTNNEKGKSCVPGGQFGVCRRWFGRCQTVNTQSPITFQVFNDGYSDPSAPADAVYIPQNGNQACIPDGSPTGFCRRWFGRGTTADGRKVLCEAFDDGYANPTNSSDAIYIPTPIPAPGQACVPDQTPSGVCRRWWGRCVAQ